MEMPETLPLTMNSTGWSALKVSRTMSALVDVCTNILSFASNSLAVVSSPAANVILCAPAANEAVAVVHTMLNVSTVIVHGEVSVAVPPDAGTSDPAGEGLAEK